jgi:hypothetical protein
MTDLDMAAEMGVWRLLENTSRVNRTLSSAAYRSVLFFVAPAMTRTGTTPISTRRRSHYAKPQYSRPATPADLFCCGPRSCRTWLLASGGTEHYDPFFGPARRSCSSARGRLTR